MKISTAVTGAWFRQKPPSVGEAGRSSKVCSRQFAVGSKTIKFAVGDKIRGFAVGNDVIRPAPTAIIRF